MSLKVPDIGELWLLDGLAGSYLDSCYIRLYQNDYTPVDGSEEADFTEADFSGYTAGGELLGTHNTPATVGGKATTSWDPFIWVHSGGATGNTIYGYYVVNFTTGEVVLAERDPNGPRSMSSLGEAINVLLTFTMKTEF